MFFNWKFNVVTGREKIAFYESVQSFSHDDLYCALMKLPIKLPPALHQLPSQRWCEPVLLIDPFDYLLLSLVRFPLLNGGMQREVIKSLDDGGFKTWVNDSPYLVRSADIFCLLLLLYFDVRGPLENSCQLYQCIACERRWIPRSSR